MFTKFSNCAFGLLKLHLKPSLGNTTVTYNFLKNFLLPIPRTTITAAELKPKGLANTCPSYSYIKTLICAAEIELITETNIHQSLNFNR